MDERLDPNQQPDFTAITLQQLEWLKVDVGAQEAKIKRSLIKDWPVSRILVVGGLLAIGITTTLSYASAGNVEKAVSMGALTGILGLIASARTIITWGVDLRGVRENRELLDEVTPAVHQRVNFDRDDLARLN